MCRRFFDFDPDPDPDLDDPLDLIDTLQNIQYLACIMPRNVQPYCL